jgi:hypothetical protein
MDPSRMMHRYSDAVEYVVAASKVKVELMAETKGCVRQLECTGDATTC